jgi:hypothetical protein
VFNRFGSVQQVVDDALYFASEARKRIMTPADVKFMIATRALSAYEEKYYIGETVTQRLAKAKAKDKSSLSVLETLKEKLRVKKYLDLCFASY